MVLRTFGANLIFFFLYNVFTHNSANVKLIKYLSINILKVQTTLKEDSIVTSLIGLTKEFLWKLKMHMSSYY